ncbi:GNAT family N-acetyltransferase [Rhodovulum sp. DZ06]|uniref:GNAT family N-acetyltransferase n=1 Tax=Rhodovulum sp. DZ06 TaxID=3425126 RepID=UPI003D353831
MPIDIDIAPTPPDDPDALALIRASHALMSALFPAEANHAFSVEDLAGPGVTFLLARDAGTGAALGCGAVAVTGDAAEIKSMFTAEAARGRGVADALLAALEARARAEGAAAMRLETGDTLAAARRLYARHGYVERGPFGDYPDHPASIFMEKRLG